LIQQAADHIARELSVTPLPAAAMKFDFEDPLVKAVYSEDFLAIDITNWGPNQTLLEFLDSLNPPAGLPTGNRLLVPLMMQMDSSQNQAIPRNKKLLVYPGALVAKRDAPSGFTVQIPVVHYPSEGVEQIASQGKWLAVVEVDQAAF